MSDFVWLSIQKKYKSDKALALTKPEHSSALGVC